MAVKKYYKGDDVKEPIYCWSDDAKTIPASDSDILEIIVRFYTDATDIKKFSKTVKTGYTQLVTTTRTIDVAGTPTSQTVYWVILEGDKTALMKSEKATCNVMLIQSDSQMPDGRLNESGEGILFELFDSENKGEI